MNTIKPSCTTFQNEIEKRQFFNKIIWRVDDVAEFLGVSVGHVYNLVLASKQMRRGSGIPYRKRGKLLYFLPNEIFDWIDEGVDYVGTIKE